MSKKGENIYKRKDNRWEARYKKGYSAGGKIYYGYCYGKTYREVKEKVNKIKAALLIGKIPQKDGRSCLSVFCEEWLQINRIKIRESTYNKYLSNIEKHINPLLGWYSIQLIDSLVIEHFSQDLLHKKKLASKTVRDILSQLKSILRYAGKFVSIPQTLDIVLPKNTKKERRVLSLEEERIFVQYLSKNMTRYKFGILLSLMTGMRIGEICALRWKDISLVDKYVRVSCTMQRLRNNDEEAPGRTSVVISEPKSESSSRIIPLNKYMMDLCKQWAVSDPNAYVLTGEASHYLEPRALQYHLSQHTKACNLEGVHFHTLRHTFATRCVEVGFDIKSLSEVLGHSSPRITLEQYVHSSLELKRDNMNKLSAIGF